MPRRQRHLSPIVRAFVDFLVENFTPVPPRAKSSVTDAAGIKLLLIGA